MHYDEGLPDAVPTREQGSEAPSSPMTRLALETIESLDGFRRLAPEWRALEARLPAVPFVTFDWADAWWKHLRSERLTAGDELFVQAFRDEGGELCGIAPLMRTFRPNFGPFAGLTSAASISRSVISDMALPIRPW